MDPALDRRIRRTRKVIRNSLVELLQKSDLSEITVKEICSLADINRSTFYLHYNNVFSLWDAVENEVVGQMHTILSGYNAAVILKEPLPMLLDVTRYLETETIFNRKLFRSRESFGLLEKVKACFIDYFVENGKEGLPPEKTADLTLYITFVMSGAVTLYYKWFLGELDITLHRLACSIERLVTGGVEDFLGSSE